MSAWAGAAIQLGIGAFGMIKANGDYNDEEMYRPLAGAPSEFVCEDPRRSSDRGREGQSKGQDP